MGSLSTLHTINNTHYGYLQQIKHAAQAHDSHPNTTSLPIGELQLRASSPITNNKALRTKTTCFPQLVFSVFMIIKKLAVSHAKIYAICKEPIMSPTGK